MRLSKNEPTRYGHSSDRWPCSPPHIPGWLMTAALTAALTTVSNGLAAKNGLAISQGLDSSSEMRAEPFTNQELSIQFAQASPAVTYPVLAIGSTGETVSQLQVILRLLGFYQGAVDGSYSASTQAAVIRFQTAAGLAADGIAGPSTWRKLLPSPEDIAVGSPQLAVDAQAADTSSPAPADTTSAAEADPPQADAPSDPPILRPNFEGSAVAQLQRELTQLGYYSGPVDGTYGEQTQAAVKKFQADQQLEVDAIVGPSTWDALTRALG
ncbi:MAG: peptidoglycan-binding protein [Phormidesmis sp.]